MNHTDPTTSTENQQSYADRVAEFHAVRRGAQAGTRVRHSYDIYFEGTVPPRRRHTAATSTGRLREIHHGCYVLRHFSLRGPLTTEEDFTAAILKSLPDATVSTVIRAAHRHTGHVWDFHAPRADLDLDETGQAS